MEKPTYEDLFEKEFNLSDKIIIPSDSVICDEYTDDIYYEPLDFIFKKDIKEFLRLLKEEMFKLFGHQTGGTMGEIDNLIDKLAGDKLC